MENILCLSKHIDNLINENNSTRLAAGDYHSSLLATDGETLPPVIREAYKKHSVTQNEEDQLRDLFTPFELTIFKGLIKPDNVSKTRDTEDTGSDELPILAAANKAASTAENEAQRFLNQRPFYSKTKFLLSMFVVPILAFLLLPPPINLPIAVNIFAGFIIAMAVGQIKDRIKRNRLMKELKSSAKPSQSNKEPSTSTSMTLLLSGQQTREHAAATTDKKNIGENALHGASGHGPLGGPAPAVVDEKDTGKEALHGASGSSSSSNSKSVGLGTATVEFSTLRGTPSSQGQS